VSQAFPEGRACGSRSFLYGVQPHRPPCTASPKRLDAVQSVRSPRSRTKSGEVDGVQERQTTAGRHHVRDERRPQGDQRVGEPAIRPAFSGYLPLLGGMTQEEAGLTVDVWLVA
jgi:hypothetical protein